MTQKKSTKFVKGHKSIGGRKKGSLNKSTVLFSSILDEEKENLVKVAIRLAKNGEVSVLNKLLDKVLPTLSHNKNENQNDDSKEFETRLEIVLAKAKQLIK
jgi:hypothetical protein